MNPPLRFSPLHFAASHITLAVAAGAFIPPSNLVAKDASGQAVLAADATGLIIAGVSYGDQEHDRRSPASGPCQARCAQGFFRFLNSTSAPVTPYDLGQAVFVEDERTIAASTTHHVVAGVAVGLEPATDDPHRCVWIFVGPLGTLPGSPTLGSQSFAMAATERPQGASRLLESVDNSGHLQNLKCQKSTPSAEPQTD